MRPRIDKARLSAIAVLITLFVGPAGNCLAQISPDAVRDNLLRHFNGSASKITALSEVMPADLYDWAPGEGVMSVANVYAHIARYNYMYLAENMGVPAPDGVDYAKLEDLTNKDEIVKALVASVDHARMAIRSLSNESLMTETVLYGQKMDAWGVLVQLVAHMNEHVGQSVAYARINNIVPPWSM